MLDVVHGFEQATGLTIPYEVVERRPGDVPRLEACPKTAQTVLGWSARRSLEEMCRDGWAWQQANPSGYGTTHDCSWWLLVLAGGGHSHALC